MCLLGLCGEFLEIRLVVVVGSLFGCRDEYSDWELYDWFDWFVEWLNFGGWVFWLVGLVLFRESFWLFCVILY